MYIGYLHRKKLVETFENYSGWGKEEIRKKKNFNFLAALHVHNLYTYRILKKICMAEEAAN